MRRLTDARRVDAFLDALGKRIRKPVKLYLTGGATAVLRGWRDSTIDIDLKLVPDTDEALRQLPRLKQELEINVELVSPDQFIPELPGWEARSLFIRQTGAVAAHHMDFYSQALAKIERGHSQDAIDVRSMFDDELIETHRLKGLFEAIEPKLYRFPAIDAVAFRAALDRLLDARSSEVS